MYNRLFIVHLLFFLIVGCANKNYNTPFINVDETINLKFGMTKDEVIKNLNEPLFVAYGDKKKTIWVYEVRTIQVKSLILPDGTTVIPVKKSTKKKNIRHSSPLDKISLVFENNELKSWSAYE